MSTSAAKMPNLSGMGNAETVSVESILETATQARRELGVDIHEQWVEAVYGEAARIADRAVVRPDRKGRFDLDRAIDRLVTSRLWGFPIMVGLFTLMFWLTISGANVPSGWLSYILLDTVHPWLKAVSASLGVPWWIDGLLLDGIYLATAWVVSVMLPPMAIFFPLFTLLEDLGYLPRVAFNLDNIFHRAGAHGKQSMSMMMGFGCNAAGVVATRIIDSPRTADRHHHQQFRPVQRTLAYADPDRVDLRGRWCLCRSRGSSPRWRWWASPCWGSSSPLRFRGGCRAPSCVGKCHPSAWSCRPTVRRASGRRSTRR
ncbi:MAG: nucleoside recognition domain-containing protein [Caldilineaceae bacterium]